MAFSLRRIGGSRFGNEDRGGSIVQHEGSEVVSGVWASNGKVFISTNNSNQLTVTHAVPRSRWMERYHTLVESDCAPIKAVFQNPQTSSQVYVVLNNSITHCMSYINNRWEKKHTLQLSNAKGAEILSIVFRHDTSMFFWCERRGASPGAASCCVCMREVSEEWDTDDFLLHISPVVAIIQCCPSMSLFIINKGVAMVPELSDERKQLLFFWTFVPRSLKVHVWNGVVIDSLDKTDFRSVILHLLPIWNAFTGDEHILCLTTHPTTLELMTLDNTYTLSYACIQDNECCIQRLSKLYVSQDTKQQEIGDFFAIGLYVGLVLESGLLEIFHSRSGLALCTITELQGLNLTVWHHHSPVSAVGVWASQGIWEIKSKAIPEIASIIQELDGCVQTENETEMEEHKGVELETAYIMCEKCFSGFKPNAMDQLCCQATTMSASLAATQFLYSWNQLSLAAKVSLNSTVLKMLCCDSDNFRNVINKQHLQILLGSSFQSPVAALALFYNHPCYRDSIFSAAKTFLMKSEANVEDSEENLVKTVLSNTLLPYIKELVKMSDIVEDMTENKTFSPSLVGEVESVREEIRHILHKLNLSKPDSESLSKLIYLQDENVEEVFHSVCYKMGLVSEETVTSQEVKLNSQRWRNIFRLEWRDGRWQRNRAAVDSVYNPSLNLLCNLLYDQEPDWLLNVYDKGLEMVNGKDSDERAKDHITQSIADSLPTLIVDPSPNSVYAHAVLLWTAGQELQAMQVILRHQMWSQALEFFSSLPEDTTSRVAIFTMMLKAFLQRGAPKEVLLKALSLVPQGFSPYELLQLFLDNSPRCERPFDVDIQVLNVGDVRRQLNEMLTQ